MNPLDYTQPLGQPSPNLQRFGEIAGGGGWGGADWGNRQLAMPTPSMPTPQSTGTSMATGGGAPMPTPWGGGGPSGVMPMSGAAAAPAPSSPGSYNPNYGGQIQMPGLAQGALSLASFAPGWPGMAAGGINDLIHGYNTLMSANQANAIGAQPPGLAAFLGGVFGLNNRGDTGGNATIADPGQWTNRLNGESPAVTQGGLYDASPFAMFARALGSVGLGSGYFDPRGAMTPGEAMSRNAMAGFAPLRLGANNGQGNNLGGNANAIHNNTVAGNKPNPNAQFDVASGTWSGGNAGGANNNSGSNAGVGSGGFGPSGNPLGAGGNNQNGGMM